MSVKSEAANVEATSTLIGVDHEDGDIVLAAGERGEETENIVEENFRVHRCIVCLPSPVFRDLVQNSHPDARVDDRPVIRCYDSATDLRALLSILYNGISPPSTAWKELRHGVIRLLQEDWPLNYSDYLNRQNQFGTPGCRVLESMKLINFAQRCEAWELLLPAFYEVAATRIQDWKDIQLDTSQKYLSRTDISRLLVGRERSAQRLVALGRWDPELQHPKCQIPVMWNRSPTAREVSILKVRNNVRLCVPRKTHQEYIYFCPNIAVILRHKLIEHHHAGASPLGALKALKRSDFNSIDLCDPCVDWLFTIVLANKMQEMWENIPVDFDLPGIDPGRFVPSLFKSR